MDSLAEYIRFNIEGKVTANFLDTIFRSEDPNTIERMNVVSDKADIEGITDIIKDYYSDKGYFHFKIQMGQKGYPAFHYFVNDSHEAEKVYITGTPTSFIVSRIADPEQIFLEYLQKK